MLSDDWTKMALLLDDRNVEFHAQYGVSARHCWHCQPCRDDALRSDSCAPALSVCPLLSGPCHCCVVLCVQRHYRTRIPKFGRDMMFFDEIAELIAVGTGSEVSRCRSTHQCGSHRREQGWG